ncbi:MAG TPA: M20 family metallopeptidase [Clostridia bacterium]|nr:M20 family metallopeptidase [Clostridia bacterium]
MNFLTEAFEKRESLISFRRMLHQHPEIGLNLPFTTDAVCAVLSEYGILHQRVAGGVIANIGKPGGKRILLRGDMDALPIAEKTGLPFASQNGAMHACGHDLHAAMLLGAAMLLQSHEDALTGEVVLMFQAGEETADGAGSMIAAGVLDPLPDFAAAIHIAGNEAYPTGAISVNTGAVYASRDEIHVCVRGMGGHGAEPHKAKNPIYCALKIIDALTDMMRLEIDAESPSVLTVCKIEGGSAANVIPETCIFSGTLRMTNEGKRAYVLARIREIAAGVAAAYGMRAEVELAGAIPMLVNDAAFAQTVQVWLESGLTGALIAPLGSHFSMGSDDFALISSRVPAVYMYILSQSPEGRHYPEHHEKVEFDDEAVPTGAAVYAEIAYRYLTQEHI